MQQRLTYDEGHGDEAALCSLRSFFFLATHLLLEMQHGSESKSVSCFESEVGWSLAAALNIKKIPERSRDGKRCAEKRLFFFFLFYSVSVGFGTGREG